MHHRPVAETTEMSEVEESAVLGPSAGREGPSLLLSEHLVVCWPSGRSLAQRLIALIHLHVAFSLGPRLWVPVSSRYEHQSCWMRTLTDDLAAT